MKKIIITLVAGMLCVNAFAQKLNQQNALNSLKDKDYAKAKEYIEKAEADQSTASDPKTYFVKGEIYMSMQGDPKYADAHPYREAAKAFVKADQLKKNYEEETIGMYMGQIIALYFNDGAKAYNAAAANHDNSKFLDAANIMGEVVDLYNASGGEKAGDKTFDTIAMQAKGFRAKSLYYGGNYNDALPALLELKNKGLKSSDMYLILVDVYEKLNKGDEELTMIKEARAAYPNDQNLQAKEINYYIKTGKQNELVQKLQEGIAKDPNNAELYSDLGIQYDNMAFPQGGTKAVNYDEDVHKAEEAYKHALSLAPENPAYNYSLGALYFNMAGNVNDQMNALGTSDAEQKKYDELKKKREDLFNAALPYLEKVYTSLDAKVGTLKKDDKETYRSSLIALSNIYARQNKMDKAGEIKKKLQDLK